MQLLAVTGRRLAIIQIYEGKSHRIVSNGDDCMIEDKKSEIIRTIRGHAEIL